MLLSQVKNQLVQNKLEGLNNWMFQIATNINPLGDSVNFWGSNRYKSPLVFVNVGQLPISYCRSFFLTTLFIYYFSNRHHGIQPYPWGVCSFPCIYPARGILDLFLRMFLSTLPVMGVDILCFPSEFGQSGQLSISVRATAILNLIKSSRRS